LNTVKLATSAKPWKEWFARKLCRVSKVTFFVVNRT